MDLAEWVAARRYPALLDLIEQLPARSRLWEAQANDPAVAAELAQLDTHGPDTQWSPRLSEWDVQAELLARLESRIGDLIQVTISAHGGKPPDFEAFPRPRTAMDEARHAVAVAEANRALAAFGFDETNFF